MKEKFICGSNLGSNGRDHSLSVKVCQNLE